MLMGPGAADAAWTIAMCGRSPVQGKDDTDRNRSSPNVVRYLDHAFELVPLFVER